MIDYFNDMTYVGVFQEAKNVLSAKVGSLEAGIVIHLEVKLQNACIRDIRYQVYGHHDAIALMAAVAHKLKNMLLADAKTLTERDIQRLYPLQKINHYCAVMVTKAIQAL